jgi:hypothetical protein
MYGVDFGGGNLLYSQVRVVGVTWKKVSDFPASVSTVTQSSKIIAVVSGNSMYKSTNGGKTFKKM